LVSADAEQLAPRHGPRNTPGQAFGPRQDRPSRNGVGPPSLPLTQQGCGESLARDCYCAGRVYGLSSSNGQWPRGEPICRRVPRPCRLNGSHHEEPYTQKRDVGECNFDTVTLLSHRLLTLLKAFVAVLSDGEMDCSCEVTLGCQRYGTVTSITGRAAGFSAKRARFSLTHS
jgi:hypothetical protein